MKPACILLGLALATTCLGGEPPATRPPTALYAMDTCLKRPYPKNDIPPAEQFALLKELGYTGIAWTEEPPEQVATAVRETESRGLAMVAIYCSARVTPEGQVQTSPQLGALMDVLRGHGTLIWVHLGGKGPAFDTLAPDAPVIEALRRLADQARDRDLRVAIYPHVGDWTERLADALRVARMVDRPNFGVTFNLCHTLAKGDESRIPALIAESGPLLFAATINGADAGVARPDWSRLIQPLDRGTYDVGVVLRALKQAGFRGFIALQGYGLGGDRRENLARSLVAWKRLAADPGPSTSAPAPYGPVPTERQLRWHELEFYGFVHFTVNTFTDKEWGYGDEPESVFNPTDFDADQIARTAREAGMKGLILTCKHHDGFCLWPSRYTEHSVKNSPWKGGKGDVVRELADACRRQGLKFGAYLSPWDRNHKDYGRPEYVAYYRNQLRELLENYGALFSVWFDGANGGDGYYGGALETRRIDNRSYYGWPETWAVVRDKMPGAVMFSDAGPDIRWVGNESGRAGDPCWATLDLTRPGRYPGGSNVGLNSGERPGTAWLPAECDVSIRPGWFYHPAEDARVKTPAQLLDIYYQSVGRGAGLNLNIPPDRRGQIHENDVRALRAFRNILDRTFATDLARDARLTASNVRGRDKTFSPENVVDGDRATYWSTDDDAHTPELVLDLGKPVRFNVVSLREYLPLGQRVEGFALDRWEEGQWREFARGTSIGNRRLVRGQPVTTDRVRLRITQAPVCPAIAELGLFAEPEPEH